MLGLVSRHVHVWAAAAFGAVEFDDTHIFSTVEGHRFQ